MEAFSLGPTGTEFRTGTGTGTGTTSEIRNRCQALSPVPEPGSVTGPEPVPGSVTGTGTLARACEMEV